MAYQLVNDDATQTSREDERGAVPGRIEGDRTPALPGAFPDPTTQMVRRKGFGRADNEVEGHTRIVDALELDSCRLAGVLDDVVPAGHPNILVERDDARRDAVAGQLTDELVPGVKR
jgi:hypothetical protein